VENNRGGQRGRKHEKLEEEKGKANDEDSSERKE